MSDYGLLLDAFKTLSDDWQAGAKRHGAELQAIDRTLYKSGPGEGTILQIRRNMISMMGSMPFRRLSFSYRETRWPLAPQNTCNIGFFLSHQGHAVGYFAGCGCLPSYTADPTNFMALMVDDDGRYVPVRGRPYRHSNGDFWRLGNSPGFLLKFDIPSHLTFPAIRLGDLVNAEHRTLYTIGTNQSAWVVSEGDFLPKESDNEDIVTTCNCFHGFCGAPLFTGEGVIVGFGATIRHIDKIGDDLVPSRGYGFSRFTRIKHMLEVIPDEVAKALDCEAV